MKRIKNDNDLREAIRGIKTTVWKGRGSKPSKVHTDTRRGYTRKEKHQQSSVPDKGAGEDD